MRYIILLLVVLACPICASTIKPYPPLTEQEIEEYHKRLVEEEERAQQAVQNLMIKLSEDPNFSLTLPLAIERAKGALEVKQILIHKFHDHPVRRSPHFRKGFYKLLHQAEIFRKDIIEFQGLINREKEDV